MRVGHFLCFVLFVAVHYVTFQAAAYFISALAGGTMFFRWLRLGMAGRRQVTVWRLYGWFSGLMMCGSSMGAVTWGAQAPRYAGSVRAAAAQDSVERASQRALSNQWLTVVAVTWAIEFTCLSVAKLMVLDRMWDFATSTAEGMSMRWVAGGRAVLALVVAGNLAALGASFAAAFQFESARAYFTEASASYAANNTADGDRLNSQAQSMVQRGFFIGAVHYFGEVTVCLLIIAAFTVVGFACALRISATLRAVLRVGAAYSRTHETSPVFAEAAAEGEKLRLQILGTTAFVFVTFLLRSAYSLFRSIALHLQDSARICPGVTSPCDATCYNVYSLIQTWMNRTLEFQVTVVLISSPFALLVALRGMTNKVISQREQYAAQLRSGPVQSGAGTG